jgi:YHS domain-containing protein
MNDLDRFEQQIREKLASVAKDRIERDQAIRHQMERRVKRLAAYEEMERRMMDSVIYPRVEAVARRFANATLSPGKGELNSHVLCHFEKSPDFPARVSLTFAVCPDLEMKCAIVTHDLEILPVYFEFQGHDQLAISTESVDEQSVGHWVESKLLAFVDAFGRLQTLDQYQVENEVIDPVCQIRFNRAAAEAEAEFEGSKYYFRLAECRRMFLADPQRYLAVAGPKSRTRSKDKSCPPDQKGDSRSLEGLKCEPQKVTPIRSLSDGWSRSGSALDLSDGSARALVYSDMRASLCTAALAR